MMKDHLLSDEVLLTRIAADDQDAFQLLFSRYKKRFYATALKLTHSTDLSEEVVQDAFVSIWTSRLVLKNVKNPSGYLFTILYNQIYAQFKKLAAERLLKEQLSRTAEREEFSTEENFHAKETSQYISRLIRQLPLRQQQIYRLSKQEGLSRNEIAQRLELSPNTVRNHLMEAMRFMKAHVYRFIIFVLLLSGL